MAIVGGMDLGYGSQVKICTTDYLVVRAASNPTNTSAKNFLAIVNSSLGKGATTTATRQKMTKFDYIILDDNAAVGGASDKTVIDGNGASVPVPLLGPSPGSLHAQADLEAHANSAAAIGDSANGIILAILSANAGTMTIDAASNTIDAAANVELAGLTGDDNSVLSHVSGVFDAQRILGNTLHTVDIGDVVAELNSLGTSISLTSGVANLNASFVPEGNAAGTTATLLSDVTSDNNVLTYVTITALVRTAQ